MFQQSMSSQAIVAHLRELCQEKNTGILYVINNGHLLGQIGLQSGEIVSITAQKKQGADAIAILLNIENGSIAFTKGVQPSNRMSLPPTADILVIFESGSTATALQSDQPSAHPSLTAAAKTVLEQTLKEYIGPIANMICTDHFRVALTLDAAIDALAGEVPSSEAATQFRERVRQRLN